jgi:hypothetical protein
MADDLTPQQAFGSEWPANYENLSRLYHSLIVPAEMLVGFEAYVAKLYEQANDPAWPLSDREHRNRKLHALKESLPLLGMHLDLRTGKITYCKPTS